MALIKPPCVTPGHRSLVVMSVYMPWDDGSIYQHDKYIFTIGCIQAVVDAHPNCNFLFGGDWNLCKNGCYSTELCVRRFCTDNELCWIDTCTDHIDYTYHNDTNDHYSLIDHFICSANLIGEGDKSAIMVDGLNTSDHFAISLKINLHTLLGGLGSSAPSITKLRWDRANLQLYQSVCAQSLASLDLPLDALLCTERECVKHNCDLDCYYMDIVRCLNTASVPAVPRVKTGVEKHWWSQELDELKSQCIEITDQWRSAGYPRSGEMQAKVQGSN